MTWRVHRNARIVFLLRSVGRRCLSEVIQSRSIADYDWLMYESTSQAHSSKQTLPHSKYLIRFSCVCWTCCYSSQWCDWNMQHVYTTPHQLPLTINLIGSFYMWTRLSHTSAHAVYIHYLRSHKQWGLTSTHIRRKLLPSFLPFFYLPRLICTTGPLQHYLVVWSISSD